MPGPRTTAHGARPGGAGARCLDGGGRCLDHGPRPAAADARTTGHGPGLEGQDNPTGKHGPRPRAAAGDAWTTAHGAWTTAHGALVGFKGEGSAGRGPVCLDKKRRPVGRPGSAKGGTRRWRGGEAASRLKDRQAPVKLCQGSFPGEMIAPSVQAAACRAEPMHGPGVKAAGKAKGDSGTPFGDRVDGP